MDLLNFFTNFSKEKKPDERAMIKILKNLWIWTHISFSLKAFGCSAVFRHGSVIKSFSLWSSYIPEVLLYFIYRLNLFALHDYSSHITSCLPIVTNMAWNLSRFDCCSRFWPGLGMNLEKPLAYYRLHHCARLLYIATNLKTKTLQ